MAVDLSVLAFKALRRAFFSAEGQPIEFELGDKRNTQDDPFDVKVFETLLGSLPNDTRCVRAPGPLVSPDMAVLRPNLCRELSKEALRNDATAAIGIEVKKLERSANGSIARSSGLDYNSTPPCGTIRVYDSGGAAVDLRGFYLFVCLERGSAAGFYKLTALVLCDGDVLNADFKYYIDITGERTKSIGVGTYGDGANRNRPMVIFANPLGSARLDHAVTLIHPADDLADNEMAAVGTVARTIPINNSRATFVCYRDARDRVATFDDLDPFPMPTRTERTSGRGRFNLGLRVGG